MDDLQASHPRAGGRGRNWPGSDISWLRLGVGCWPCTSLWCRSWGGLGCEIWVFCQPVGHGSGAGLVGGGTAKASSPSPLATIMSPQAWPEPCENFKILDPGFSFKGCSLPRERMDVRPLFRSCVCLAQSCPTLCDPMDYIAHQAPLSMGFSRLEYWNDLPFPSQGIVQTQGLNLGLPHCRKILYPQSHQGSPPRRDN